MKSVKTVSLTKKYLNGTHETLVLSNISLEIGKGEFIDGITDCLGIREKLWQMPNTLSGGQQQRVAIARALITKPAIVLADEPTGNLDSRGSREVVALMRKLSVQYGQTVVIVTHNEEIASAAERIIHIEDGRII